MKSETELRPQPGPQEAFLSTQADLAVYGGAAGSGKSFALLLEPLYHIGNGKFRCVLFRRTQPQLRQPGGLWDTSEQVYPLLGAKANQTTMEWTFPGGATIRMAGMEHEQDRFAWQGAQVPLIEFDELCQFTEPQFWYLLSRCRSMSGVRGYIRAATNPDADSWVRNFLRWWLDDATGLPIKERSGMLRWFVRCGDELHWADSRVELVERFGPEALPKSATFIPANIHDNQLLLTKDPDYLANLKSLPLVEREQLLCGNWNVRAQAGNFFRREWFQIVDHAPSEVVARVRFWDRAASEHRPGTDPDATVGLLLSKDSTGCYYIERVVKMFSTPGAVQQAIVNTARQDGVETMVAYHQDPASAGKFEATETAKALDGFDVRFTTATGDKETRAKPVSAQAEAGNIKIVRGSWNDDFLRELEGFPIAKHDDQVDALSGAHSMLVSQSGPMATVIATNSHRHRGLGASRFIDDIDRLPHPVRGRPLI